MREEFTITAMETGMYRKREYMVLPVVLAMAILLMVAVVAVHGVCAGVSGCSLNSGARSGPPDSRIETSTYTYVAILEFAKAKAPAKKPPADEKLTRSQTVPVVR